jgi:chemotaxis protein methyltransferase CheR
VSVENALVALLEEVSGNVVPDRDRDRVLRIAMRRAEETTGGDLDRYLVALENRRDSPEWRRLLSEITVNESYLFRAPQQFAALETILLPTLIATRTQRRLRVWTAGCARGEEAVSLAITLAESRCLAGWSWTVDATDVDDQALEQARRGEFGRRAMARVSPARVARWFRPVGGGWAPVDELHRRIRFLHLNLADPRFTPPRDSLDVVFLRNVLIYFRPERQRRVIERIAEFLAPDAVVFLGPSESLWRVSDRLVPEDLGSCFCYRPRVVPTPDPPVDVLAADPVRPVRDVRRGAAEGRGRAIDLLVRGEADRAAAWLVGELQQHPEDAHLRTLGARADELLGDQDSARRGYRAAVYLEPHLFHARILLAGCLVRGGKPGRARAEWLAVRESIESGRAVLLVGWDRLGLPDQTTAHAAALDALGVASEGQPES